MQKVSTATTSRIPNILIYHNFSKQSWISTHSDHLLKYFPKYYHHLTLEITSHKPLLTKVKRIKRLKRFTSYFKHDKASAIWPSLLKDHRKDIEELPRLILSIPNYKQAELVLERLMQWNLKSLPNLTTLTEIIRQRRIFQGMNEDDYDDSFFSKRFFVKYVRNLRKVKTLEISSGQTTHKGLKWLDGMRKTFKRIQSLKISLKYHYNYNMRISNIFDSKAIISHITSLTLPHYLIKCDKNLTLLPKICKNLRSLSIGFSCSMDKNQEFLTFLKRLQKLKKLVCLELKLPKGLQYYWSSFKPQTSLKFLKLRFNSSDLIKGGFCVANGKNKGKKVVEHWENIEKMEEIEFDVFCDEAQDIDSVRLFMTMVLKKARELCSLKYFIHILKRNKQFSASNEPFFVEGTTHLRQSLESFEYRMEEKNCMAFDLSRLKVFKNLKEVKLEGNGGDFENIEVLVDLLEREGEYTTLQLNLKEVNSVELFQEIIEKIAEGKGSGRNLKIMLNIDFWMEKLKIHNLEFLEDLCYAMEFVGFIPRLLVRLKFLDWEDESIIGTDAFKEMIRRIRNLTLTFRPCSSGMTYRKVDGEKEQFHINRDYY